MMTCPDCGYTGRGSRGHYFSHTKGQHWQCPECREFLKIIPKKPLPRIKGYCKDCKYSYIEDGKIMNRCKNFGDVIVLASHYCSEWEVKDAR